VAFVSGFRIAFARIALHSLEQYSWVATMVSNSSPQILQVFFITLLSQAPCLDHQSQHVSSSIGVANFWHE
jgi:hypothetical protein